MFGSNDYGQLLLPLIYPKISADTSKLLNFESLAKHLPVEEILEVVCGDKFTLLLCKEAKRTLYITGPDQLIDLATKQQRLIVLA